MQPDPSFMDKIEQFPDNIEKSIG